MQHLELKIALRLTQNQHFDRTDLIVQLCKSIKNCSFCVYNCTQLKSRVALRLYKIADNSTSVETSLSPLGPRCRRWFCIQTLPSRLPPVHIRRLPDSRAWQSAVVRCVPACQQPHQLIYTRSGSRNFITAQSQQLVMVAPPPPWYCLGLMLKEANDCAPLDVAGLG